MKLPELSLAAVLLSIVFFGPSVAMANEPVTGPVIEGYGPVYEFPDAGFRLDPEILYRSVMDVSASPDDHAALNRYIESAARFLNMHARDGVPVSRLEVAVVLHGSAGKDALNDDAYAKRFGQPNPNTQMMNALRAAGVRFYLCAQTAGFRGYGAQELSPAVTMATSAMTVLTRLQVEGWSLLP